MRGQQCKNIFAENSRAAMPYQSAKQSMAAKKRMCWRCQQDKSTVDGHIKLFTGGPMKFICKECLDKKAASAKEAA